MALKGYVGEGSITPPYAAVAYIEVTYSDLTVAYGTGMVVGVNDVLTTASLVSHAVHGDAISVTVTPGRSAVYAMPFGTYAAASVDTIALAPEGARTAGFIPANQDVAILGFKEPIGELIGGWVSMDLSSNGGGVYLSGSHQSQILGYQMTVGGSSIPDPFMVAYFGHATHDGSTGEFILTDNLNTADSYFYPPYSDIVLPGASVWVDEGGAPIVAGAFTHDRHAATTFENSDNLLAWMTANDAFLLTDSIRGTSLADTLYGSPGNEVIYGGSGADFLQGLSGGDIIYGNKQNDALYGNLGDDVLYGGQHQDTLGGGPGDDLIYGNLAFDLIRGDGGDDIIYGGQGDDIVYAGDGNDRVMGNAGNDFLYGGAGDDWMQGDGGTNWVSGGDGVDLAVMAGNLASYFIENSQDGGLTFLDSERVFYESNPLIDYNAEMLKTVEVTRVAADVEELRFAYDDQIGVINLDITLSLDRLANRRDDYSGDSSQPGALLSLDFQHIGFMVRAGWGTIDVDYDSDWFALPLNAGDSVDFSIRGPIGRIPFLSVHGSEGAWLAGTDLFVEDYASQDRFSYMAPVTGTYYLVVDDGYLDDAITPYEIQAVIW